MSDFNSLKKIFNSQRREFVRLILLILSATLAVGGSLLISIATVEITTPTPITITTPQSCQEEGQGDFPCYYIVSDGDSLWSITKDFYGNEMLMTLLMDVNRNPDGTYHELKVGDWILIPNLDSTPLPDFPYCSDVPSRPCLYEVEAQGFKFEWLSDLFYGTEDFGYWIRDANFGPGGTVIERLDRGDVIVIPVSPENQY